MYKKKRKKKVKKTKIIRKKNSLSKKILQHQHLQVNLLCLNVWKFSEPATDNKTCWKEDNVVWHVLIDFCNKAAFCSVILILEVTSDVSKTTLEGKRPDAKDTTVNVRVAVDSPIASSVASSVACFVAFELEVASMVMTMCEDGWMGKFVILSFLFISFISFVVLPLPSLMYSTLPVSVFKRLLLEWMMFKTRFKSWAFSIRTLIMLVNQTFGIPVLEVSCWSTCSIFKISKNRRNALSKL